MHPILFKLGPVTVYSYGTAIALAFLISTYLLLKEAARTRVIKTDELLDLMLYIVIFGILGARLLHVVLNMPLYVNNPIQILFLNRGGLAFHGGMAAGVAVSLWFLKKRNLPIWKVLDLGVPFVALGHSIGRIGCFMNGCCFGKPGHPTQLYSALSLFLIFLILRRLYKRPHSDGKIFASYLVLYSVSRFLIDFLRVDIFPVFLGLTTSQLISIGIFVIGTTIALKK